MQQAARSVGPERQVHRLTNIEDGNARAQQDFDLIEMLRNVIALLVDWPECLNIRETRRGEDVTFVIQLALPDLNHFQGAHERTGESLRVVVKAAGMRLKRRILLEFEAVDPAAEAPAPAPPEG